MIDFPVTSAFLLVIAGAVLASAFCLVLRERTTQREKDEEDEADRRLDAIDKRVAKLERERDPHYTMRDTVDDPT